MRHDGGGIEGNRRGHATSELIALIRDFELNAKSACLRIGDGADKLDPAGHRFPRCKPGDAFAADLEVTDLKLGYLAGDEQRIALDDGGNGIALEDVIANLGRALFDHAVERRLDL